MVEDRVRGIRQRPVGSCDDGVHEMAGIQFGVQEDKRDRPYEGEEQGR